jgi:hypothetical protein
MKTNRELKDSFALYRYNGVRKLWEVFIGIYSQTVIETFSTADQCSHYVAEYNARFANNPPSIALDCLSVS